MTLKTGRPRNIAAQETASPQEQSTATSHQPEPSDLLQNPHTPRARRSRKSIPAEETPRSTRHSARLKAQSSLYSNEDATPDEEEEGKELPGSPGTASNDESNDASQGLQNGIRESQDRKTSATTPPMPDDPTSDPAEEPNRSQRGDSQGSNAEHNPDHKVPKEPSPEDGKPTFQQSLSNPVNTPSPSGPRKRKSNDLEEDDPRSGTGSPAKKVKIDSELDPVPEEQSPDENNEKKESDTPMDGTEESRGDGEPDQTMKEADTTPETGIEISSTPRTRGGKRGVRGRRRGRGGRNRPVARVNTIRRGAGRGRASRVRGGRAHANFSDDVEFRRSPSPSAETKKLRDRQRELDKAFRRVAAAQRLALAELASQSENRLMRDKTAHATVAEYEIVKAALRERLQAKQEELRHEYELKVEQEMRLLEAEKGRINESFRVRPISQPTFGSASH